MRSHNHPTNIPQSIRLKLSIVGRRRVLRGGTRWLSLNTTLGPTAGTRRFLYEIYLPTLPSMHRRTREKRPLLGRRGRGVERQQGLSRMRRGLLERQQDLRGGHGIRCMRCKSGELSNAAVGPGDARRTTAPVDCPRAMTLPWAPTTPRRTRPAPRPPTAEAHRPRSRRCSRARDPSWTRASPHRGAGRRGRRAPRAPRTAGGRPTVGHPRARPAVGALRARTRPSRAPRPWK